MQLKACTELRGSAARGVLLRSETGRSEGRLYVEGVCISGTEISFFFQAEDGIRDYKVTGVQTCALPICVPLLLLSAADDPFIPARCIPRVTNPVVELEISPRGGHLGFIEGPIWRPRYYAERRGAGVPGTPPPDTPGQKPIQNPTLPRVGPRGVAQPPSAAPPRIPPAP